MKKEDITGMIVYVLILAVAIIFGLTVLQEYSRSANMDTGEFVLFVLLAILSGVIVNSIVFEVAHIVGAKVGRYDIISVNILGFCSNSS